MVYCHQNTLEDEKDQKEETSKEFDLRRTDGTGTKLLGTELRSTRGDFPDHEREAEAAKTCYHSPVLGYPAI